MKATVPQDEFHSHREPFAMSSRAGPRKSRKMDCLILEASIGEASLSK